MNAVAAKTSKQTRILAELRRKIVGGKWAPGSRMPAHSELKRLFKASPGTVQSALNTLQSDGFVSARRRAGTFVAAHPPHLSRYALVFPSHPSKSRYLLALWKEASEMSREESKRIDVFDHVEPRADNESYQRLVRDVKAQRLAGLIFANVPFELKGTPLVDEPGMPRVAIMSDRKHVDIPNVTFDGKSQIRQAMEYFASRGRKRVAILAVRNFLDAAESDIAKATASCSLELRPYWQQMPDAEFPRSAHACAQLLMRPGQADYPDALWISDDNLVEAATAGLVDAGVRVPHDLDVVAHCNFPWKPPSRLGVRWLGFDARQLLSACVRSIDLQRQGESPETIFVPAVLEK